jgi:hypothetical protein
MSGKLPILWVGPAGSGKLTAARAVAGADGSPRLQHLEIGDYSARYWAFPTHIEMDCMDFSMKDKQILPELLNQLLSTGDVLTAGRKLVILRRVHGLSPPAAVRIRACLEELVWSSSAPAMIWMTARVVNAVVASLADGFVYRRVVARGEDRVEKTTLATHLGIDIASIPTIQSYIAETLRQMLFALEEGPPTLAAAGWIRARVYDLLGLMATGADIVAGLTWATVRLAAAGGISTPQAKAALRVLAQARWYPSYRTPLMLELIMTAVYNALAAH